MRKSRIRIFLEKGSILVLTSVNFEKKGLFFMSSVLLWKGGFIWGEKPLFYLKKGGSFWTEKSVFYREKGVVLSWKVSVLPQKRRSFSNWRARMGTIVSSEWGSRGITISDAYATKWYYEHQWLWIRLRLSFFLFKLCNIYFQPLLSHTLCPFIQIVQFIFFIFYVIILKMCIMYFIILCVPSFKLCIINFLIFCVPYSNCVLLIFSQNCSNYVLFIFTHCVP